MSQLAPMPMIARPCPVCGSADESRVFAEANYDFAKLGAYGFASRKLPEYMHYRLIECPVCDLLYASPVPSPESLSEAYRDAAFDSQEEARYAAKTYASFLPGLRAHLPDADSALDIGTSDGAFLEELLAAGFTQATGVEPSAAPVAAAKPHIRSLIRLEMFRPEQFGPESFSLISCFQTLEHLSDPMAICRAAHRLLKPGGAVFFIAHNRRSVSARIMGTKSPIFDIEHLQLFSPASARSMLEQAEFGDVRVMTVYNRYPIHYWTKLLPLPSSMKRPAIRALKAAKVGYIPFKLPAGNLAIIGFKSGRRSLDRQGG